MRVHKTVVFGVAFAIALVVASSAGANSFLSGASTFTTQAAPAASSATLQAEVDHQLAITHGGTQVAPNVVSYANNSVRMVFPLPGQAYAVDPSTSPSALFYDHGCPYGYLTSKWSCFYQEANFQGRMLEFEDCGYEQYFSTYGFQNQTSSWVNTKNYAYVVVRNQANQFLWHENPASDRATLTHNNQAWKFYIHANGNCQN